MGSRKGDGGEGTVDTNGYEGKGGDKSEPNNRKKMGQ